MGPKPFQPDIGGDLDMEPTLDKPFQLMRRANTSFRLGMEESASGDDAMPAVAKPFILAQRARISFGKCLYSLFVLTFCALLISFRGL